MGQYTSLSSFFSTLLHTPRFHYAPNLRLSFHSFLRDTLSEVPSLRSNLISLCLDNCHSSFLAPLLPHSHPLSRQKSKQSLKNIKPSYYSSTQKLPLVFHQTSNKIQIPHYGPQNPPSPALSASQSSSDPMLSLSLHAPGPFSSSSQQPHTCPFSLTPAPPHWTLEYIPL